MLSNSPFVAASTRSDRMYQIQEAITNCVYPVEWRTNGGMFNLSSIDDKLLVEGTPAMHRQVEALLNAMRTH